MRKLFIPIIAVAAIAGTTIAAATAWNSSRVKTYTNARLALQHTVTVSGRSYRVYEGVVGGKPEMVVTDTSDTVVRDARTSYAAALASVLARYYTSDVELRANRQQQENLRAYLKWESLAQLALFVRDAASRALVDVSVIYLTGDTTNLSRAAAKRIAKSAVKSTISEVVRNPDNYLRAIAMQFVKTARDELRAVEREALAWRSGAINADRVTALDLRAGRAYTMVVPGMQLVADLRPDANIRAQMSDVATRMREQLLSQIPGGDGVLSEIESQSIYAKIGQTIDEIYQRYVPYRRYQEERKRYEALVTRDREARGQVVREKLANGLELTNGYARFSASN